MATKKDLVEAYSFSRRRLVTAFVSGAPGGREVEPARPGRTIVGGVALAVLLAAGAAIAGVFAPTAPTDWKQRGLIISKETGAAYVITDDSDDPELHPVINATSAALILGADTEPTLIAQDTIDDQRIGSDIGILGAPASVPTTSRLIDSGWTACTADEAGVRLTVSTTPDVTAAPVTGLTVISDGLYYAVIAGPEQTYAYPVPEQRRPGGGVQTDPLLNALGLQPTASAMEVSRSWLELFPAGAALDFSSFPLHRFGQVPTYVDDDAAFAGRHVGDLLVTPDGEQILLADDGPTDLDEFQAALYRRVVRPDHTVVEETPVDAAPGGHYFSMQELSTAWPTSVLAGGVAAPDQPCAQLATEAGRPPIVRLAAAGVSTSGAEVDHGEISRGVDPGRGAFVLSGSFSGGTEGSPFLIDAKARANPLVGDDTAGLLGYDEEDAPVVPDSWVKLFACGVPLSQADALLPPGDDAEGSGHADNPACS